MKPYIKTLIYFFICVLLIVASVGLGVPELAAFFVIIALLVGGIALDEYQKSIDNA